MNIHKIIMKDNKLIIMYSNIILILFKLITNSPILKIHKKFDYIMD